MAKQLNNTKLFSSRPNQITLLLIAALAVAFGAGFLFEKQMNRSRAVTNTSNTVVPTITPEVTQTRPIERYRSDSPDDIFSDTNRTYVSYREGTTFTLVMAFIPDYADIQFDEALQKERLYFNKSTQSNDQKLSALPFTPIHSLEWGLSYGKPRIINNYFAVPYRGGDYADLVIFNTNGEIITKSVSRDNTELSHWIISLKDEIENNDTIVPINLYKIDSSKAEAQIDLSTGKVVAGTYKEL